MTRGAPDHYGWDTPRVFRQSVGSSIYAFSITTDPETVAGSPKETDLTLEKGFLAHARVLIPPGHAGLTGLALFKESGQIIPKTDPSWFIGDDYVYEYPVDIDVDLWSGAYKLQAKTYNTDDTFDHTIYLYLMIVGYPA